MKVLKKDLMKYKDMYKCELKILDRLFCYCLNLIKNNFKDNIDLVKYIDELKLECNLFALILDTLWIQKKDMLEHYFNNEKERKLLSDKTIFNVIKGLYEKFKKVAIK